MKKITLVLIFTCFALLISACANNSNYEEFLTVTTDIEQVPEEGEYLLYYFSPECSYCAKFKPTLEEYAKKENSLPIFQFDLLDDEGNLAGAYFAEKYELYIQGTPTLVHIKDGEFINQLDGVQELEDIPVK